MIPPGAAEDQAEVSALSSEHFFCVGADLEWVAKRSGDGIVDIVAACIAIPLGYTCHSACRLSVRWLDGCADNGIG